MSSDPEQRHVCFLEKGYCKALCDFLFEQFIQNSFGPRPPCTKYNQEVIDLCQPAMQKRSEEHSSPKRCFFLPSFLCCLFLYKKGKKTIPLLSHPLLVIFEARPSLLVLHACINKLTTDFRRSRPPPNHPLVLLSDFLSSSHLLNHRTNQWPLLFLLLSMSFVQHTHTVDAGVNFHSIENVNRKCNSDYDATAVTVNAHFFYAADIRAGR